MRATVRITALLLSLLAFFCGCTRRVCTIGTGAMISDGMGSFSSGASLSAAPSQTVSFEETETPSPTEAPSVTSPSPESSPVLSLPSQLSSTVSPSPEGPTVSVVPSPSPTPSTAPAPTPGLSDEYLTNTELPFAPFYPEEKLVAFTFDDGPEAGTPLVLAALKEGDYVTFFVNGYNMGKKGERYLKQAYDAGHEIGIHTYDHVALYDSDKKENASEEVLAQQLLRIDERVLSITGEKPWLLRPPGGHFVRGRNYGYVVVGWSVDTKDWMYKHQYHEGECTFEEAVQMIYERNIERIQSGDIVLMHDTSDVSAAAFEKLYTELKARGYRFVTVSELLGIEPKEYIGYYFENTGCYGYSTVRYTLSRSNGRIITKVYQYPFEIHSPILKREEE